MNNLKNFLMAIALGLGLLLFMSCENWLEVDPPNDRLDRSVIFADSASASLTLAGIHNDMISSSSGFVTVLSSLAGLSAGELSYTLSNQDLMQFDQSNILADNATILRTWNNIYKHVYQCNSAIEGIEGAENIAPTAKSLLIGEARFMRALLYFHTVNCWGSIPLVTSSDYRVNEVIGRTPIDEIYEQIVTDLEYATQNMNDMYLAPERARPNRLSAFALLARVYLFRQQWELAEQAATVVINSGLYSLEASLTDVFLKESNEVIWQMAPSTGNSAHTPAAGYLPINANDNSLPQFLINENLYLSFDPSDRRRADWIGIKSIGPHYYSIKYRVRSAPMSSRSEYTVMLRLAEQFLIRAEARAELGQLTPAIDDLNVIRARASIVDLPIGASTEQVLANVEAERYRELFADWGAHRWFDLKRKGRIDAVVGPLKGSNWKPTDAWWPIPLTQLLTNSNLVQNDGY